MDQYVLQPESKTLLAMPHLLNKLIYHTVFMVIFKRIFKNYYADAIAMTDIEKLKNRESDFFEVRFKDVVYKAGKNPEEYLKLIGDEFKDIEKFVREEVSLEGALMKEILLDLEVMTFSQFFMCLDYLLSVIYSITIFVKDLKFRQLIFNIVMINCLPDADRISSILEKESIDKLGASWELIYEKNK